MLTPLTIATVPFVVVAAAALIAAFTDLRKFKVYNALTFPLVFAGLVYYTSVDGWSGLSSSFGGMLFGFATLIVFHVMGGVGAGDVKLMAGFGAWLGVHNTLCLFIASSLVMGVCSLVLMVKRGRWAETMFTVQWTLFRLLSGRWLSGGGSEGEMTVTDLADRSDRRGRLIPFAAMALVGLMLTCVWRELAA